MQLQLMIYEVLQTEITSSKMIKNPKGFGFSVFYKAALFDFQGEVRAEEEA